MGSAWATFGLLAVLLALLVTCELQLSSAVRRSLTFWRQMVSPILERGSSRSAATTSDSNPAATRLSSCRRLRELASL